MTFEEFHRTSTLAYTRSIPSWPPPSALDQLAETFVPAHRVVYLVLLLTGHLPQSIRANRRVRELTGICRKKGEGAAGGVYLIIMFVFAFVGAELLALIEERLVPVAAQDLDIVSLAAARNGCERSNFDAPDRVGFRLGNRAVHPGCMESIQSALPLPGSCCENDGMVRVSWAAVLAMKVSTSCGVAWARATCRM